MGAMDSKQQLTPLGLHLASLPVDLRYFYHINLCVIISRAFQQFLIFIFIFFFRVGKIILFGAIFRCIDSALTIAACLSYKSPFTYPWKKRQEAQAKKLEWSTAQSDHLTVLKAFNV